MGVTLVWPIYGVDFPIKSSSLPSPLVKGTEINKAKLTGWRAGGVEIGMAQKL